MNEYMPAEKVLRKERPHFDMALISVYFLINLFIFIGVLLFFALWILASELHFHLFEEKSIKKLYLKIYNFEDIARS